jgi:SAM-dependent methyltransferase
MERYLELSRDDIATFFADPSEREVVDCPACGGGNPEPAFEKHGFQYVECADCHSLFVSPRPRSETLDAFYEDSESSRFWAREFFPTVSEARRERIIRPRVQRVLERARGAGLPDAPVVVDAGAGAGTFLVEVQAALPTANCIAVEPGAELAQACRDAGLDVVEAPAEHADAAAEAGDIVTSFEVIEHVHDPLAFVSALARLAKPGAQVLVTGLGGDGFDVRVLGPAANAVSPPHHLNFLSVAGLERLFERAGLTEVEVETPGELDVELVQKSNAPVGAFLELLLHRRDADVQADFQAFLKRAKLSSHAWIWARKPA